MLTHPVDSSYTLVEVADLEGGPLPAPVRPHEAALRAVLAWTREYLCRPHPRLGRPGNVCPYAQAALDRASLYLAVQPGRDHPPADIERRLLVYRDWFLRLSAAAAHPHLTTIVTVFPELLPEDVPSVIDATQARLKPGYVARGLMLGEFHDGPPAKPGLWNDGFRPLRSPLPLLAIRHMVPTDAMFLCDDPDHLREYLRRFGGQVPASLRAVARRAAQRFGVPLTGVGGADGR
ncbi:MAG TPA: hypothetical protein VNV66_11845 [Pilimelia sp.]|nr:hypothetical protein [Pilimelia sp.]